MEMGLFQRRTTLRFGIAGAHSTRESVCAVHHHSLCFSSNGKTHSCNKPNLSSSYRQITAAKLRKICKKQDFFCKIKETQEPHLLKQLFLLLILPKNSKYIFKKLYHGKNRQGCLLTSHECYEIQNQHILPYCSLMDLLHREK